MSTLSQSSGTLFPDQFTAQLHIQFEHFYDAQLWTRGFCFCFLFLPHSSQTFPKLKDPFPRPIYSLATHRVSTLLWCTALNQVHEWFLAFLFFSNFTSQFPNLKTLFPNQVTVKLHTQWSGPQAIFFFNLTVPKLFQTWRPFPQANLLLSCIHGVNAFMMHNSELGPQVISHSFFFICFFKTSFPKFFASLRTLFPDQFTTQLHTQFEHLYDAQLWTRSTSDFSHF